MEGGTSREERRERDDRRERDRDRERGRGRDEERERDKEKERDRERDDRRERDRDRVGGRIRRPNVPPPPPPSEDGSAEIDIESTYVPMNHANGSGKAGDGATTKHQADSSSSSGATSSIGGTSSTAATTPHVSMPVTPSLSPTQSSVKAPSAAIEGGGGGQLQLLQQLPSPQQHLLSAVERAPISGSRTITIDTSNMPSTTDDASVLSVPSHVVLHHLCTSAIKNGVLAVANTTRYKKKVSHPFYFENVFFC